MLRITRHRAGKAVLFQQCAWCVEVLFDCLLIQLSNAKQRKGKQRKQIMTKSPSTFHQKSSKIVLKSRSRGGLGNSWGLSLLQVALSWASWGVLGSIWHKKLEKRRKTGPFWLFLERLGRHFGAHVGSKRPSWLHLGRLGLDDGKRSMALAIGD